MKSLGKEKDIADQQSLSLTVQFVDVGCYYEWP